MSWIIENSLNKFQYFLVNVLKCGPIPKHVGIIMDGNRRYARKINVEKVVGHTMGFDKLSETLEWCKEMGIKEVTVYAFSMENFKRTPEEVADLMDLATEKFKDLLKEENKLMMEGICVRVIGDLSMLRKDLQKLIAKAMLLTKDNTKSFLNIAFAYVSREEITTSVKSVIKGVEDELIDKDDVTDRLISQCLYLNSFPDLLIRTSGEVRLSDFLLWQSSNSIVYFSQVLWPEFSFWDFVVCILHYQKSYYKLDEIKLNSTAGVPQNKRVEKYLSILRENKFKLLETYALNE
ncbi:dehydrodolichyl diphosphate synthase complex subunit DHDDS-like [Coccinella septempunctata]|uniref:dehydrodolichyl diphosphate synthase complex subunit DHDDS-like n=1 Tax=Coccinella septempunctata TaxID=41139 RepID=UPI001D062CF9|nr:dehydrodolichyl diphosphate synthase complex subunit DHDDS-like [Coccinella septempunctata]